MVRLGSPSTSGSPRRRGSAPTPTSLGWEMVAPQFPTFACCRTATARSRPTPAGTPIGAFPTFYDEGTLKLNRAQVKPFVEKQPTVMSGIRWD